MLTQTLVELIVAATLFTGGHFLLSSRPIRAALVRALTEPRFLALYSVIMLLSFGWLVVSYLRAPVQVLWATPPWAHPVALWIMPFAFVLLAGALRPDNPTAVGTLGKRNVPLPAFVAITRHPFLWAVTLWAVVHIPANGDVASLILFGSLLALALFGTLAIDAKLRARDPQRWKKLAIATSNLPFAAIVAGRAKLAPSALLRPLVIGITLYVIVLYSHRWIFGVSPL